MERKMSLSRQRIMDRLAEILFLKQSGTFYIATNMNTSCRFGIENGKLMHCTHQHARGMHAVRSLLEIRDGSCSFAESQLLPFRQEDVIDHHASLALLDLRPVLPVRTCLTKPHRVHHLNPRNGAQADGY